MRKRLFGLVVLAVICSNPALANQSFLGFSAGFSLFGSGGGLMLEGGRGTVSGFVGVGMISGSGDTGYQVGFKFYPSSVGEGFYLSAAYGSIGGEEQWGGRKTLRNTSYDGPSALIGYLAPIGSGPLYWDLALGVAYNSDANTQASRRKIDDDVNEYGLAGLIKVGYSF